MKPRRLASATICSITLAVGWVGWASDMGFLISNLRFQMTQNDTRHPASGVTPLPSRVTRGWGTSGLIPNAFDYGAIMRRAARQTASGRRTGALARALGLGGVEALGQAAALAGGGVLVDRALAGHPVELLHDLLQLGRGHVKLAGGDGGGETLHRVLD